MTTLPDGTSFRNDLDRSESSRRLSGSLRWRFLGLRFMGRLPHWQMIDRPNSRCLRAVERKREGNRKRVCRLSGGNAGACLLPVQNVKQWESTTYRFGEEPGNPLKTLTFSSS